uniref:Gypsy retrotransposon integrase-like protein 1 n=1 Tax=Astyanax mexicanus TaxID=7994 RepID=A0A3B1KES6_ASTMX
MFPIAFYSKKLTQAERNYDVGNRELLAIKLALEEWRHCWRGPSIHSWYTRTIVIWSTSERPSAYLLAKPGGLFSLPDFNFLSLTDQDQRTAKLNALSRIHERDPAINKDQPIIEPTCLVAPVLWEVDQEISAAAAVDPGPSDKPPNKVYVPEVVRGKLITWAHTSIATGHPGVTKTAQLLSDRYWWPNLHVDVQRFVKSCSVCAQCKVPRLLPAGKLQPLPIPQRPWTHLSVDFVTDLPASDGNTTILVVVDRFSKGCCLILSQAYLLLTRTAEALFQNVFRRYGLPEDIVSDRGSQFTSQIWTAFMERLGVNVSLTSGHHPESNGQVERLNQEIGRYLRSHCADRQGDWCRFLPWAEYAQNSLIHSSSGLTPFQCFLGYQPPLFPWTPACESVPAVEEWFRRSGEVWESAHVQLERAIRRQK